MKRNEYRIALKHACNAIHSDSTDVTKSKSYYLQGKAQLALHEYSAALELLTKASHLVPVDKGTILILLPTIPFDFYTYLCACIYVCYI